MDKRALLIIAATVAAAVVAIAVAISTRPQCPECQPCPTPPNAAVRPPEKFVIMLRPRR